MKVTKAAGLYTSENPYNTPEGSLKTADNVVIRNKDVIEPRRGSDLLSYTLSSGTARADEVAFFGTTPIVSSVDGSTYKLVHDTGAALTNYTGTYTPPSTTLLRTKFAEARGRLYCTTDAGLYVVPTVTTTPETAGMPRAADPEYYGGYSSPSLSGAPDATGSWLAKNSAVSYVLLYGRKNSDGFVKWGAPSGRLVVVNPADITASLAKVANTVTATVTSHQYKVGDKVSITPGGAGSGGSNFGTGGATGQTITAVTTTTITYIDVTASADGVLAAQTITSKTKATTLALRPPIGLAIGDYIRLYRTLASASASVDPGAEHYLVHENLLTNADLVSQLYTSAPYVDTTPETALSSDALYTNEDTGEGADQANFRPPLANDVVLWNNRLWLGNTKAKHSFDVRMLGVGSPNGVQSGDTILLGDAVYSLTEPVGLSSSLKTQESSQVITAKSREINYNLVGNFAVFYASGVNDPAGMMQVEEVTVGGSTGYLAASRPASFSPALPQLYHINAGGLTRAGSVVTATTTAAHGFSVGDTVYVAYDSVFSFDTNYARGVKTITVVPTTTTFKYVEADANVSASTTPYDVCNTTVPTDNETRSNRLYYSRLQEPEAVPVVNYLDVGSASAAILRIIPLRDKLYVFKEDGIYTVSGEYPFRVDLLDNTVKLVAPDSVAVVSNRIFGLTSQGIVAVTEAGAGIVSRPIESDILPLITNATAAFKRACFGVGYETERQYLLWLPSSASSSTTDQAYVYHVLNNAWTRRTDTRRCGRVSPSDYLYLGPSTNATLSKERKTFLALADFADESYSPAAYTVNTSTGTATTLTFPATTLFSVGDYVTSTFDLGAFGVVTAVTSTTVTIATTAAFPTVVSGNTSVTGSKSYQCIVAYNPQTAGAPGVAKHFREVSLLFGDASFNYGYITTQTELSASSTSDLISTTAVDPFHACRKTIPLANQRGSLLRLGFSMREAFSKFKLYGYSVEVEAMSERVAR